MEFDAFIAGLFSQIDHYTHSAAKHVKFAKTAQRNDRAVKDVWFDPTDGSVIVRRQFPGHRSDTPGIKIAAAEESPIQNHWCGLALSCDGGYFQAAKEIADGMMGFRKSAATTGEKTKSLLGWDDRYYATNPLAAMLATGVLGAGLGYGGASLASLLLPNSWDKKKFRRSGALLGGAIGAAPGAAESLKSLLIGQPLLDGSHMRLKESAYPEPQISGEELIRMTWQHPLVSCQMTPGQQVLMSGAVHGATQISGSPFFTPRDMARLTAGMGSGYATGLIAGRVLGALTGMPESAQSTLANTGMYAGALKGILPLIYQQR